MKIFLAKSTMVLVGALALGLGSAWWAINAGFSRAVQNGAWFTGLSIGSSDAGPYMRAAVARAGLLALNKSETVYFTAISDDSGERLSTACTYKLVGQPLATRWWSITAYGADHYLIPNSENRYSQAMNTVTRDDQNGYTILVSPDGTVANSIPTGFEGVSSDSNKGAAFSLTLRLYNPDEETYNNLADIHLPTVAKEGCQ